MFGLLLILVETHFDVQNKRAIRLLLMLPPRTILEDGPIRSYLVDGKRVSSQDIEKV